MLYTCTYTHSSACAIKLTSRERERESERERNHRWRRGGQKQRERERAAGYKAELTTMEVGSQGMLADSDLDALREAIDAPRKEFTGLCLLAIRTAILGSFSIWCSRNCIT